MAGDLDISGGIIVDSSGTVVSRDLQTPWATRPTNWGRRWAEAKAAASTRPVIVDFWGDSITRGTGAAPGAGDDFWTEWWTDSYVGRTIARLQALYGDGGTGYVGLQLPGTTTGTWTPVAAGTGAPYGASIVTATAAASIEVTVRGSEIRIPYMNAGVTGSWRYQVDGGGFTTVTTPSGLGLDPAVEILTLQTDATHLVRIEWVSGTVRLCGIEARRPTGVLRRLFAQGGRLASEFGSAEIKHMTISWTNASATITAPATTAGFTAADIGAYVKCQPGTGLPADARITAVASATSATISSAATAAGTNQFAVLSYLPASVESAASFPITDRTANGFGQAGVGSADLVIIGLGVNDGTGAPIWSNAQRAAEGVAAIATAYVNKTPQPDFIILIQHWGNRGDIESDYPFIVGHLKNVADGIDAAVIDMWSFGKHDYNYMSTQYGYWADTVHPGPAGHQVIADRILELLT